MNIQQEDVLKLAQEKIYIFIIISYNKRFNENGKTCIEIKKMKNNEHEKL